MAGAIAGIRGFVKSVSVGGCGNRTIHRARIGTGAILAGGFRRFIRIVKIAAQGESDRALSVLSVAFIAGEDGAGRLDLVLADGAVIALSVECLDVVLKDVTRPYIARVQKVPSHF